MPQSRTLYAGLDVQKPSIAAAYVAHEHGAEVTFLGAIGPRPADIAPRVRQLPSKATHLVFVDEEDPGGPGSLAL
jgi:hypothetical protein